MHSHSHSHSSTIIPIHEDIIRSHILTKLDGQALASAGFASRHLHSLCSQDVLWSEICSSNWPSSNDPRIRDVISTFPSGYRSFFSDSFPAFDYSVRSNSAVPASAPVLISAVDLFYEDDVVFSKVESVGTDTDWFLNSPFRVELLEPKEMVPTTVDFDSEFGDQLRLSWIAIDPARKRSVNVSSIRPVSVKRHWLTGDVVVKYSTVVPAGGHVSGGGSSEFVNISIEVTCGGREGGKVHVSGVSMHVQDMEGKSLCGKDSLVIIQGAMGSRRKRRDEKGEERKMYEEFVEMKRKRKEVKERSEKSLDMVFVTTGITIFLGFLSFFIL